MSGTFMGIDAPMCGYAPDFEALITTVQDQDPPDIDRLQARAEIINIRYGLDLTIYHARLWVDNHNIPDVYGYRYGNHSGAAYDMDRMWTWLNGVQAGLEMRE